MGLQVKPVNPKGNQPWVFTGRTDAEAEAPIIWPPDTKSRLTGKDPDDGKDWGQEEKGATEDGMVGWHQWLSGDEFEQTLGDGEGQGNLACCSLWRHKELDTMERLNNIHSKWRSQVLPLVLSEQTHTVKSCPTLANPWTVAHQAPLSIGVQSTNLPHAKQMPDWQREKNFFSLCFLPRQEVKCYKCKG